VVFGSLAAIVMRIILTVVAAQVLALRWLGIIGSALLLWIGIGQVTDLRAAIRFSRHSRQ
jgi:predicted tellurium resistance membrane protein TerC